MVGNADIFKEKTPASGTTTTDGKAATTDPAKHDATTTTTAEHHDGTENHDNPTGGPQPNKLEAEGVLAWSDPSSWSHLFSEGKKLATSIFKSADAATPFQTVADVTVITCDDIFKKTGTDKPPATTTTDTNAAATKDTKGGISDWFSSMGKAVSDIGSKITGKVTDGLDWIFKKENPNGTESTVSAKNGEAHVKGTDKNGNANDVTVDKHTIKGDHVGIAQIMENKDTKESHYHSGTFDVNRNGPITTAVDSATNQRFEWNSKTQQGSIKDKDGKPLMTFDSLESLNSQMQTQTLTDHTKLSQTNAPADATADHVARDMRNGKIPTETRYIVDNNGNSAVVRDDGLIIKTYKKEGFVTIEKDGHMIKIQDHHAMYLQADGDKKHWVPMKDARLPKGVFDIQGDGTVAVDGQTVVNNKGNVQADSTTTITTKTGAVTAQSDTGTVTVNNNDGKTTVKHDGQGEIENDGHKFHQRDRNCRFGSWDPEHHQIQMFGDGEPGHDGITLDTRPGGDLVIQDHGQTTTMNENGAISSRDAQGNNLLSIDSKGNVTIFDGTRIGADGSVTNEYGSGKAWDGGASASGAIAKANGAVASAAGAINNYFPDYGALGALDDAGAELSSLVQTYTAMGCLDIVASLHSAESQVAATRAAIAARIDAANTSKDVLGGSSPELTAMIIQSGLPPQAALKMLQEKGVIKDPAQGNVA